MDHEIINYDTLVSYNDNIGDLLTKRYNYKAAPAKWEHCYVLFGHLISQYNKNNDHRTFLTNMKELAYFAVDITFDHDNVFSFYQLIFESYDNSTYQKIYNVGNIHELSPNEKNKLDTLKSNTNNEFNKRYGFKVKYDDIKKIPIYKYLLSTIEKYEQIRVHDIVYSQQFNNYFYMLFIPVFRQTGYSIENMHEIIDDMINIFNKFTHKDYIIKQCARNDYYCGRAFVPINIYPSKFLICNTVEPALVDKYMPVAYLEKEYELKDKCESIKGGGLKISGFFTGSLFNHGFELIRPSLGEIDGLYQETNILIKNKQHGWEMIIDVFTIGLSPILYIRYFSLNDISYGFPTNTKLGDFIKTMKENGYEYEMIKKVYTDSVYNVNIEPTVEMCNYFKNQNAINEKYKLKYMKYKMKYLMKKNY